MKNDKLKNEKSPEELEAMYAENLVSISNIASKTNRNVGHSMEILTENLETKVQKIKMLSSQAVYAIQEISLHTKTKIILFGTVMFFSGAFLTSILYNVFLTNIMNKYLYKTIESMAEKPVQEAKKEAERILLEANVKADGMLKNTKNYILENQMEHIQATEGENKKNEK